MNDISANDENLPSDYSHLNSKPRPLFDALPQNSASLGDTKRQLFSP